jgi:uncharacterized protein YprB with RNaseH-like and TPR domain
MISLKDRLLRDVMGARRGEPSAFADATADKSGAPETNDDARRDGTRGCGPSGPHRDASRPADILGGVDHEQGFVVVERKYPPGHRHGDVTVADGLPPSDGAWPALDLLARAACRDRLLFVDLETTGLAGGAGTYAFLVGCAWFDGGSFRVRQYLMSNPMVERSMLGAIAELAGDAGTVVTYNGKTFDLPLIETRYLYHRLETPFSGLPHVDMLHPARRLWRGQASGGDEYGMFDAGGCRLTTLERTLCGFEREGDVPGFEIPDRYFRYVRTGDARPLEGVLEHNRLDLLSLALLTARAAQLVEDGPPAVRTAREAVGLGRLYQLAGRLDEARRCFALACGLDASAPGVPLPAAGDGAELRADALSSFARLSRRARFFDDAAAAWSCLLTLPNCPPAIMREAAEALAVHHEHRRRDPLSARGFALQSLQLPLSATRREALHHRVARLDRKLASAPVVTTASLF